MAHSILPLLLQTHEKAAMAVFRDTHEELTVLSMVAIYLRNEHDNKRLCAFNGLMLFCFKFWLGVE